MPGFGWRPSTDPRNANHPMRAAIPASVSPQMPTLKTWSFVGHPLDQGETSTCVAHAAAHFIHCGPLKHKAFLDPFRLYREIVLLDEYGDNDHEASGSIDGMQSGSSGTGGAKALEKRGLLKEYLWADRMETAIGWILTRGPIMFGGNWYSSMSNPTREGFVKIAPSAANIGGHEWLWRGIDLRRGIGEGINSWGIRTFNPLPSGRWASEYLRPGHFMFDLNDVLRRLFVEDGDAISGIERAA